MPEIVHANHASTKLIKQGKLKITQTPYTIYQTSDGKVCCETPRCRFVLAATLQAYSMMSETFIEYTIYDEDRYDERAMSELWGPSGGR